MVINSVVVEIFRAKPKRRPNLLGVRDRHCHPLQHAASIQIKTEKTSTGSPVWIKLFKQLKYCNTDYEEI